ncbi:MAG: site-specific integrase [Hyphomicrobium sp.]|nr:MAG: site-specific integrase [Hyphomicrobium sp.]
MADIRKREGANGTTYQVRYASPGSKTGYAYATFKTRKEALAYREDSTARLHPTSSGSKLSVPEAIDQWLRICEKEGTDGNEPVTEYTLKTYRYFADYMKSYGWAALLPALKPTDIVAFRTWLLEHCPSRYVARRTLSYFHSALDEMTLRGHIDANVSAGINISAASRYDQPVTPPSLDEFKALLAAADRLANSKNLQIAKTWKRYRPMLYLAADSGMRPQEYIVVSRSSLLDGGVKVDRALERGDEKISVTKTPAGRRFIDLSEETFDMVQHHAIHDAIENDYDLVFPTSEGKWQSQDNWRKRGFYEACFEAGLTVSDKEDGDTVERPKFRPYDLRHFYASMLIERKVSLKRIQKLMGHSDIKTTLNVYGHIIERVEEEYEDQISLIGMIRESGCGESVASAE